MQYCEMKICKDASSAMNVCWPAKANVRAYRGNAAIGLFKRKSCPAAFFGYQQAPCTVGSI